MPPQLAMWARLVQRKVTGSWTRPENIRLDGPETTAAVVFRVDRNGNLFDGPAVAREGSDPAVGRSGVAALRCAQPLPPLPADFPESGIEVEMTFTVSR